MGGVFGAKFNTTPTVARAIGHDEVDGASRGNISESMPLTSQLDIIGDGDEPSAKKSAKAEGSKAAAKKARRQEARRRNQDDR